MTESELLLKLISKFCNLNVSVPSGWYLPLLSGPLSRLEGRGIPTSTVN